MLPLVVAEQFGTLATLYPDRIELGLGRAPGTDQVTMRALRRGHQETEDQFPRDVVEILQYFKAPSSGPKDYCDTWTKYSCTCLVVRFKLI